MTESIDPALPILDEMNSIMNYLNATGEILESGFMPDITGLEDRVAELCTRIQKAPKEVHERALPQLVILLDNLNICEQKMREFQGERTKPESGNDK